MTQQNALVWEGGSVVGIRRATVPESRPGWLAVDIAYAGICCGDLHIAAGEHGRAQPGIVLRHEFVGHLAEPYGDLPVGPFRPGHSDLADLQHDCRLTLAIVDGINGATAPHSLELSQFFT